MNKQSEMYRIFLLDNRRYNWLYKYNSVNTQNNSWTEITFLPQAGVCHSVGHTTETKNRIIIKHKENFRFTLQNLCKYGEQFERIWDVLDLDFEDSPNCIELPLSLSI